MNTSLRHRPALARYGVSFLVWTLYGTIGIGQAYLNYASFDEASPPVGAIVALHVGPYLVWALATPTILSLAGRRPVRPRGILRWLPAHLAAVAFLALASTAVYTTVSWNLMPRMPTLPGPGAYFFVVLANRATAALVLYAGLIALGNAIDSQRRLREREVGAAQLEAQLASARLEALRSQLHPHFLFNALNTVAMHLRDAGSPDGLDVVVKLSELLRRILRGQAHEATLEEELELVELYLAVERARFADRLRVEVDVPEAARRGRVPVLLLQPLVENAIRHGIARSRTGGRLRIAAEVDGGRLRVRVVDDGPGIHADAEEGVGLSNTRARLEQLHPGAHRLVLRTVEWGAEAVVELPYRPVPDSRAEVVGEAHGADSYARR